MSDSQQSRMSDAEREVLKVLWEHGPKTVRELVDLLDEQGQEWARSTVITLVQRLERKGYVKSDKSAPTFVFHSAVTREQAVHARIVEAAKEFCEGEALPIVLAFAEQHDFSKAELQRLRDMIDALSAKRRKRDSK